MSWEDLYLLLRQDFLSDSNTCTPFEMYRDCLSMQDRDINERKYYAQFLGSYLNVVLLPDNSKKH